MGALCTLCNDLLSQTQRTGASHTCAAETLLQAQTRLALRTALRTSATRVQHNQRRPRATLYEQLTCRHRMTALTLQTGLALYAELQTATARVKTVAKSGRGPRCMSN
jgi:hypothetical protein